MLKINTVSPFHHSQYEFITENSVDIKDEYIQNAERVLNRAENQIKLNEILYDIDKSIKIELSIFEFSLIYCLNNNLNDHFIKAVYDNSSRIRPGSGRADRLRNAHLFYCYLIASFPWDVVQASGTWTEWVEFLDSKRIREDPRIVEWFVQRKVMAHRMNRGISREQWFRSITRTIRNELRQIDTTVLEKNELFEKLDKLLENMNHKHQRNQ